MADLEEKKLSNIQILSIIQAQLKAPKNQYNNFGRYNYRSCEDILEALKPFILKYKVAVTSTFEVIPVGNRTYVKSTARLGFEDGSCIETTGYAREAEIKKGMDECQITGAAISYATKYALNGLFAIDDTKDSDALNETEQQVVKKSLLSLEQVNELEKLIKETNTDLNKFLSFFKVKNLNEVPLKMAKDMLEKKIKALTEN